MTRSKVSPAVVSGAALYDSVRLVVIFSATIGPALIAAVSEADSDELARSVTLTL